MRKIIKTKNLGLNDIPIFNATWEQISDFALTFDPELELGTYNIYDHANMNYSERSTIKELRTCLFLQQRWWNNRSNEIDEKGLSEVQNVLNLLRKKVESKTSTQQRWI